MAFLLVLVLVLGLGLVTGVSNGAPAAGDATQAATGATTGATTDPKTASTGVHPGELVPWDQEGTFASLLARAKKQKKLVFVDFYATWCGPCKMMDRQTYTDSTVGRTATAYLNRKVDGEKGEGLTLVRRYNVTAYPTLLIVDAQGKEKAREVGFRPPDRFARYLDDTRTGRGTIEGIQALIAKGQDTATNRLALTEKLVQRGDFAGAGANFARAMALEPADASGRAAETVLMVAGSAGAAGQLDSALVNLDRWLERVPADHPRMVDVLVQRANTFATQGKNPEALDVLRRVIAIRGNDPAYLAAFARFCASTNQALDEALTHANRAVDASNGDAGALDALAAVQGARGDWDAAVATAEKAVALKPNDGYLRGRLERFQEQAVEHAKSNPR